MGTIVDGEFEETDVTPARGKFNGYARAMNLRPTRAGTMPVMAGIIWTPGVSLATMFRAASLRGTPRKVVMQHPMKKLVFERGGTANRSGKDAEANPKQSSKGQARVRAATQGGPKTQMSDAK
ncbi:hypothetical protein DFH09DRAFT_1103440 [Mycena vulgaris]|nr:hypothetical protein DFH09DRAFT_1103440 [Mycena vulgaris]